MPSAHARFGGSTAFTWMNCALSVPLCEQMPPAPSNLAADEGTALHEVMDIMLKDASKMPEDFLGAKVKGIKIEQRHIPQLDIALRAYEEISNEFDGEIKSEQRVVITDDAWGTSDILLYNKKKLIVADFKFGQGIVEAEMNDQALFYAVAARKTLKINPAVIELVIIQPSMDPAIDRHEVPAKVVDAFEESIYAALKAANAPHPMPTEGEWCKWRPCKLTCPAKLGKLSTLTMPNHALKLDDVGAFLLKLREFDQWMKDAEERIHHELSHGVAVRGWKLVNRRAIRQWKSEEAAVNALRRAKVKPVDYQVTKLISPAQAEKYLDKKTVAGLADPVSSGTTIAPMDDKRPAVVPPAAVGTALKKLMS